MTWANDFRKKYLNADIVATILGCIYIGGGILAYGSVYIKCGVALIIQGFLLTEYCILFVSLQSDVMELIFNRIR